MGVRSSDFVSTGSDAAECIADAATKRKCDLVVIGSHGRTALQRLLYGSVVTRVITMCTKPVLVCKAQDTPTVRAIKKVSLPTIAKRRARPRRAVAA